MKLSVSVPDELWSRAASLSSTTSPSAVVQTALEAWLADESLTGGYKVRPALHGKQEDALAETLARLAAEATASFQTGYQVGLELAGTLKLPQVSWLVKHGVVEAARMTAEIEGDIAMQRGPQNAYGAIVGEHALRAAVGSLADFTGGDGYIPEVEFLEGVDMALRDVHRQALAGQAEP